jgi:hypothetical protein
LQLGAGWALYEVSIVFVTALIGAGTTKWSMPISYAEPRYMVFPKSAVLGRSLFTGKRKQ